MRQAKYQIGQIFTKEVSHKICGQTIKGTIQGVVTAISVESTDIGYAYYYKLRAHLPEAYYEPALVEANISEDRLTKEWDV